MAREFIKREAALKRSCLMMIGNYIGEFVDVADIKKIPSVDVVEVVRCKDCKFLHPAAAANRFYCDWHREAFETSLDAFCSYGERRED